jgi:hypothetical protein
MATAENIAGEFAAPPPADSLRGRLQQAVENIRALSQQQKNWRAKCSSTVWRSNRKPS